MRCPSCNSKIPDDSRVCPNCGKKLKRKYKRKKERDYEKRKKKANGLVFLIVFLCVLLLAGFILVAVKLLFLDDYARRNVAEEPEIEMEAGLADNSIEVTGETIVQSDSGESDANLENSEQGPADAADYDLTRQESITLTGLMYMRGSEKEMLLAEPKSFYGKNTTGTNVLVSQVDSIRFASTGSNVSVEDLHSIPNGAKLTCTGSLYIHDNDVFIRLDSIEWKSWEEETGTEADVG